MVPKIFGSINRDLSSISLFEIRFLLPCSLMDGVSSAVMLTDVSEEDCTMSLLSFGDARTKPPMPC